jgi:hypothetical protein
LHTLTLGSQGLAWAKALGTGLTVRMTAAANARVKRRLLERTAGTPTQDNYGEIILFLIFRQD